MFGDAGFIIEYVPPFPMMMGFPDGSQVKPLSEKSEFWPKVREVFNNLMESQKFVTNREEVGKYGKKNLNTNPSLDQTEYFIEDGSDTSAMSAKKDTYLDLVANVNAQKFSEAAEKCEKSMQNISEALKYINEKGDELDAKWNAHNAYVVNSVGLFAHEEVLSNMQAFRDKLEECVNNEEDGDDKNRHKDMLRSLDQKKSELEQSYQEVRGKGLATKYVWKEAMNITGISKANMSLTSMHRRKIEEVSRQKRQRQENERQLKITEAKAQAKAEARRKEYAMKSEALSRAKRKQASKVR